MFVLGLEAGVHASGRNRVRKGRRALECVDAGKQKLSGGRRQRASEGEGIEGRQMAALVTRLHLIS